MKASCCLSASTAALLLVCTTVRLTTAATPGGASEPSASKDVASPSPAQRTTDDAALTAAKKPRAARKVPRPIYDTREEILAMPRCKAVVVTKGPCYVSLRTKDGKEFNLGSPGMNAEVGRFLEALNEGETYKFPKAFAKYLKSRSKTKT